MEGTQITFDILTQKNWFWVIPFSNGRSSLGLVCPKEYLETIDTGDNSKTFENIIQQSEYYKERFEGLNFLFEPKKIVSYSAAVKKLYGPGFALTGNSAEFLDPVFSSGVCFASESGALSAKLAARQVLGENVDWENEYEKYILFGVNVFRSYVKTWYTGELQRLFFHPEVNEDIRRKLCSVLAGYVWDKENPFVAKHDRAVQAIAHVLT
jgi:flavin-dependent dehydrogenase